MIAEDYVSFEVAKLLKEKGFKESTQLVWYEHLPSPNAVYNSEIGKPKRDYFYWEKEGERNSPWTNNSPIPSYINGEIYSCPTLQMAMKWLREIHKLSIDICTVQGREVSYMFNIWDFPNIHDNKFIGGTFDLREQSGSFKSYEEAVETAIKYSLENLI